MEETPSLHESPLDRVVILRQERCVQHLSIDVDIVVDATSEQSHQRVRLEKRDLLFEPVGRAYIVCIHPRDVFAPRELAAAVERLDDAPVVLTKDPGSCVLAAVRLEDRRGPVRGTIIDDDELEIAKALVEDALEGLRQEALTVEHRHDDRNEWSSHVSCPWCRAQGTSTRTAASPSCKLT